MSDVNAVVALKNAWNGVVAASATLSEMADAVQALPGDATVASLDLETYQRVALAQANAARALQGLIEQLQRKTAAE
jgi:hypothetical protein